MTASPINTDRKSLIAWTGASFVLVALLVGLALLGGGPGHSVPAGRSVLTGLACVAPFLIVVLLLAQQTQPSTLALGFASALGVGVSGAIAILIVVGIFGRLVVLLTMFSIPIVAGLMMGLVQIARELYQMNPIAVILLFVLGVVQFQVAKLARQARGGASIRSSQWAIGRATGFVSLGAIALVAWSGRSHAETVDVQAFEKKQEQRMTDERDAYHTMLRIQACAAGYADSVSKGNYPTTLAEMGPGGSKCLDARQTVGTASGYRWEYHPITDSSGSNAGWWATAMRSLGREAEGFVGDHTGALYQRRVVHYHAQNNTREDSAVVLRAWMSSDLSNLVRGAECIRDEQAKDTTNAGYPPELTGIAGRCLRIARNRMVWGEHLVSYDPDKPDRGGRIKGFVVHATAVPYGRDAVRSYLIEPDGVVNVTTRQRPAAATDPVYVGCEFDNTIPCRIAQ